MDEADFYPCASTNTQADDYAESSASSSDSALCPPYISYSEHRRDHTKSTLILSIPPHSETGAFEGNLNNAFSTIIGDDDDVFMAETWSAPTQVGSECDNAGGCAVWQTLSSHMVPEIHISPPSPSLDGTARGDFEGEIAEASCEPFCIEEDELASLGGRLIPIGSDLSDESYQEAPPYKPPEEEEDDVMSLDSASMSPRHDIANEFHIQSEVSEDSQTLVETAGGSVVGSEADSDHWEHMSGTTCIYETNVTGQRFQGGGAHIMSSTELYINRSQDLPNVLNKGSKPWSQQWEETRGRAPTTGGYQASRLGKNDEDIDIRLLQHQNIISREHRHIGLPHTGIHRERITCATICAFCGSIFSGPCHKVQALDHIQLKHLLHETDPKDPVLCRTQAKLCDKPQHTKSEAWRSSGLPPGPDKVPSIWQDQLRHDLTSDLKNVGTKWQDEARSPRGLVDSFTVAMAMAESSRSSYHPDPQTLMNRIQSLFNTRDGDVHSERINDFFNGLEVVAHDLKHQRPKYNVSHVIQDIISAVKKNLETANSQASAATNIPETTVDGKRACPASAQSENSGQSNSLAPTKDGLQSSTNDGTSRASAPRDATAGNDQKQALEVGVQEPRVRYTEGRRLACLFSKNDEVHGQIPSCRFKGAGTMSAVKIHLTSREHSRDVPFIRHCRNCSDYIIDESDWRDRHENRLCTTKKQSRGDLEVVRQWRELFEKVIPNSNRIPHPYVGNPTWVPKAHPMRHDGTESRITRAGTVFDFNNPVTSSTLAADTTMTLPSQTATTWVGPPRSDSDSQTATARVMLFEPSPTIVPYQPSVSHPETTAYNQAFLDEPLLIARNQTFRAVPLHNQISSTNIATTRPSDISNQEHDVYAPRENVWSSAEVGPLSTTRLQQDQAIESSSQNLGEDHTRIAVLQTVLDLLEAYTRQDNISMSADLAHRIAHVHALSPEECKIMHTDLLARVMSTAEQLRVQGAALGNSDTGSAPQLLVEPQTVENLDTDQRSQSPELDLGLNLRPLEPWEMGLFTPATQEHVPTWHSDEFLTRLAARSLDELTLPVYVPT